MSFDNLKRNKDQISKLIQEATKISGGEKKSFVDERFWKPTVDKAGNGYAVIRFLPAPTNEELPWVRYWDHGFKGPTGLWYIENSLTSIGKPDPVGELNSRLWNTGIDTDKDRARTQKRRLHYVTNIYIVSDPSNPDTEGKVYLYQFGKKIFDKIMDVMQPSFADEKAINPFDFWEGANFKLKIRQVEGYRNYDKSEFATPTGLSEDEATLKSIYEKQSSLQEFVNPENFKSYEELKAKLNRVLGEEASQGANTIKQEAQLGQTQSPPKIKSEPETAEQMSAKSDDDETMSYFAKLAEED